MPLAAVPGRVLAVAASVFAVLYAAVKSVCHFVTCSEPLAGYDDDTLDDDLTSSSIWDAI